MKIPFRELTTWTAAAAVALCSYAKAAEGLEHQMMVQRACEAAIWAMPAAAMIDFEKATKRDLGGDVNDVVYVSKPFASRHGFLTANDVTPYAWSSMSTEDGPLVVEVPPANDKVGYFGTIVDAWDVPLIDVGTTGHDKGKGAKYLLLPPGHEGDIPEGYVAVPATTYNSGFSFRPVMKADATFEDTTAYAKELKIYHLSEADNPPATKHIDAFPKKYGSLPTYDMTYFQDIYDVINREPVREQDKAMMALLAGIGIEKGKPFEPTADQEKAMLEGLSRAYDWMQAYFTTDGKAVLPWWEDRKWYMWNFAEGQAEAGFPYVTEDRILIDERSGGSFFWITYLPKNLGGGTFYLTGLRTADGEMFNGKDTYKLTVPPDTPANDFWSVIVYSMKSKGFVEDVDRVGLSSRQLDQMKKNADGSVDIYFAPKPVENFESNTIPTGEDFFLLFRLYGPDKSFFTKKWKLDDVQKIR
ncbi:hypothetical protein CA13_18510 [Planctomycetes bacterium CA13]|uniref:DUF1254 domain-containing protein n=1 Tax=Novipirellula herctigrandis TaxID=2527986 RepID=A0A5C5YZG8_9BACT|nr:hypothetical protein CA13_18510 [Planctomycetes bacterium CA13]